MARVRKKEGFQGQRAIVLPKQVLSIQCAANNVIGDAYVTDIGYYPQAVNHYRKRPQGVDQNILIYCVEGTGWAEIGNVKQNIAAGNFFVVPAQVPHAYGSDADAPWTIYWIHVRGSKAKDICSAITAKCKGFRGIVKYSEQRISLFNEIYTTLERGYGSEHVTYANMCLPHYLASFYLDEKFCYSEQTSSLDPASIAIDFMQENLARPLTLKAIALRVNLSVSHFVALFHKRTGFAPIEYFNHLKIQKACQYLQFTNEPITAIAAAVGIEDGYYFSRLFKKLMGRSPLHYRQRFQHEK